MIKRWRDVAHERGEGQIDVEQVRRDLGLLPYSAGSPLPGPDELDPKQVDTRSPGIIREEYFKHKREEKLARKRLEWAAIRAERLRRAAEREKGDE